MGARAETKATRRDRIEAAFGALRAAHPGALVFAIGGDTVPRVVELPAGLAGPQQPSTVDTGTLVDRVHPDDRVVVARLWGRARVEGAAAGLVREAADPDRPSMLYLFDLRDAHGAMIGVYTAGNAERHPVFDDLVRSPQYVPRVGRAVRDASAIYLSVDTALERILGWDAEDLIGHRALEFVHPDDHEAGIAAWMDMLETPGTSPSVRLRHRHRNGSWVWMEVTHHNHLDESGGGEIVSDLVDISDEMGALAALRAREQLLGQLTETVPVGLFHVDLGGSLLFANRRLHDITGAPDGSPLSAHLADVVPEDRRKFEAAVAAAKEGVDTDVEIRLLPAGANIKHCTVSVRSLRDEHGTVTGLTGCVEDVTIAVRNREELEARATIDPLTQCLNRGATLALLQELLDDDDAGIEPTAKGTAAIFVDLDGFKPINDELGHAAGDDLLVRVARRLRSSVRSGDVVGRFGGDEFVVVCPEVASEVDAMRIAGSIAARAFGTGLELPGTTHEVRASFGVAWTRRGMAEATELIRRADTAMYHSKHAGRSEPVLFDAAQ